MKGKAGKVVFGLTLLFYAVLIVLSVYGAIKGVSFMSSEVFGWDAFVLSIIYYGFLFVVRIPLLPATVLYDIGYLVWKAVRTNRSKRA